MVIYQIKSKRKVTGGRFKNKYVKRKSQIGRPPSMTKIGDSKVKKVRVLGGNYKFKSISAEKVNVFNPTDKKTVVADLKKVIENGANVNYARRNIITKGSLIDTSLGKAKVTNRPGQDGLVNAVLVA